MVGVVTAALWHPFAFWAASNTLLLGVLRAVPRSVSRYPREIMRILAEVTLGSGALAVIGGLVGCTSAADRANENLSKAAENFEVPRRIVGINAITDKVLFSVEGYCSYETSGGTIDVICATQSEDRKSHVMRTTLGKSDNVTFVSTQLESVEVDFFRPRVIFRPENVVPNFDLSTSSNPSE